MNLKPLMDSKRDQQNQSFLFVTWHLQAFVSSKYIIIHKQWDTKSFIFLSIPVEYRVSLMGYKR